MVSILGLLSIAAFFQGACTQGKVYIVIAGNV